ncbi:phosphatidate cytidylyltransferase [Micromonospora eburnea]|uniref:Phosphatidate cytidylyltransferase n=1 Tax=Micromonospora eburnea TaxID=227316 RepID=A0A1C6TYE2_9ACTN|nr:phosphatidate cytidylyltransferase [Micromonospora eburnea]SCL46693.1 phosphatidate cytidylyltransferase [Micromonospora eburnea]
MSRPDPYGAAEPRGWDRPAPLPWPETDLEPQPWRRPDGPEAYAESPGGAGSATDPHARPWPDDDRYDAPGGRRRYEDHPRHGGDDHGYRETDRGWHSRTGYRDDQGHPDAGRGERDRWDRERDRWDGEPAYRDAGREEHRWDGDPAYLDAGPGHRDEPRYRDADHDPPERGYDEPVQGSRPYAPDDEYATAQIAPVRDEPAQAGAGPDDPTGQLAAVRDEPPPGRRGRGRRRASADRPATAQPTTGRAGRNLPAAIGVGLALGAAILLPLFLYPPAFLVVIAAAMAIGSWEMARAVRRGGAHPPLVPLIAGGVITVGLAWFAGPDALSLGLLVTVLGTMIWRLGDGPGNYQRDLTAATLIAVYVPFLGGFAAMLAATPGDGHLRVLVTLVAVVLSDTGGYAAGVAFGKHPMAPRISPKKSWEGFAGSLTAAAAGSALLLWLLLDVAPWWGALFGVAISCAAVVGDLAESMIKRDLGVKDMSNLLPGHGGLMDRLDSILFAVPAAYLLLTVLVPAVG